jgi:hypothetical protein
MSLIQSRENFSDQILERRFIRRVLQDTSKDIDKAQHSYMSSRGFEQNDWFSGRGFVVTETELGYTHLKKHRFNDMKFRTSKKGKTRRKSHPIHNRIIWGQYNNVIKELHFGFTNAVKDELRNLQD